MVQIFCFATCISPLPSLPCLLYFLYFLSGCAYIAGTYCKRIGEHIVFSELSNFNMLVEIGIFQYAQTKIPLIGCQEQF